MQTLFVSDNCHKLFIQKELAVIGISPFNSYFSEQRIAYLYQWAKSRFNQVKFYVPDGPTIFTLQAIGYDELKAIKKAKRQCNYLHNKIQRAVPDENLQQTIVNSAWLDNCPIYQQKLALCHQLFETNLKFRRGCIETSRWVLSSYDQEAADNPQAQLMAVKYFLAELPVFIGSADILNVSHVSFCYHSCPQFLRELFENDAFDLIDGRHGFTVLKDKSA